jgi:hypothetical protein
MIFSENRCTPFRITLWRLWRKQVFFIDAVCGAGAGIFAQQKAPDDAGA